MISKKFAATTELLSNDPAAKRERKVAQCGRSRKKNSRSAKGLIDAVIGGERVLLAVDPGPGERGTQLQIRTALSSAGIRVLPHSIFPCHACGVKPRKEAGLGRACADLICVVPPYGRFCAIEVKTEKTKDRKRDKHQREWAKWIRYYGGVAGVATTVEEAFALVAMARKLPELGTCYVGR